MELQEVEVCIDKDGKVSIAVRGVQGTACLDITQPLEAALGGQVESRQMTAEAYETIQQPSQEQQHLGQGQ